MLSAKQGDLRDFLKRKEALKPALAVRFALDIARFVEFICFCVLFFSIRYVEKYVPESAF